MFFTKINTFIKIIYFENYLVNKKIILKKFGINKKIYIIAKNNRTIRN
jgi:hypothetical protein